MHGECRRGVVGVVLPVGAAALGGLDRFFFFFFNDPPPTEIYPLPLPAPLPTPWYPPQRRPSTGARRAWRRDPAPRRLRRRPAPLRSGSGARPCPGSPAPGRRRCGRPAGHWLGRSEEHTSELQSQSNLVCRLLLE